jgi:hypothetical protein
METQGDRTRDTPGGKGLKFVSEQGLLETDGIITGEFDLEAFTKIMSGIKKQKDEIKIRADIIEAYKKDKADPELKKWTTWLLSVTNGVAKANISKTFYGVQTPASVQTVADIYRSLCVDIHYAFRGLTLNTRDSYLAACRRSARWNSLKAMTWLPFASDTSIFLITHGNPGTSARATAAAKYKVRCLYISYLKSKNPEFLVEAVATESRMNSLLRNAPAGASDVTVEEPKPHALQGGAAVSIIDDVSRNYGVELLAAIRGQGRNAIQTVKVNKPNDVPIPDLYKVYMAPNYVPGEEEEPESTTKAGTSSTASSAGARSAKGKDK